MLDKATLTREVNQISCTIVSRPTPRSNVLKCCVRLGGQRQERHLWLRVVAEAKPIPASFKATSKYYLRNIQVAESRTGHEHIISIAGFLMDEYQSIGKLVFEAEDKFNFSFCNQKLIWILFLRMDRIKLSLWRYYEKSVSLHRSLAGTGRFGLGGYIVLHIAVYCEHFTDRF
ncbi:hypothetical protein Droror1_Dr00005353 [Drosera rotundifolia]